MKSRIAVVGAGVLLSTVGYGVVHAQAATSISVPAPASVSKAVAVQVGKLASVGETGATATKTGGAAAAKPVALGETPLLSGVKATTKTAGDALIDTGETALGRVTVAGWSTNVKPGEVSSTASLATAKINGLGDVAVAPSSSLAQWTPAKSTASSVSDGAIIHLGDYTIKVLHAESGSSASGKTYLVQLIGKDLGITNGAGCLIDVGPLATVGCLSAVTGVGADANVAQAILGKAGPVGKVVAAASSGGTAVVTNNSGTSVLNQETSRAVTTSSGFARTGANILEMLALGLMLAVAGATALYGNRRVQLVPLHNHR